MNNCDLYHHRRFNVTKNFRKNGTLRKWIAWLLYTRVHVKLMPQLTLHTTEGRHKLAVQHDLRRKMKNEWKPVFDRGRISMTIFWQQRYTIYFLFSFFCKRQLTIDVIKLKDWSFAVHYILQNDIFRPREIKGA